MPTPDILAAQFGRCVERFRNADAKAEQKAEFRALLTMLQGESLSLRDDGGRVTVNGAAVDGPEVASLVKRLALHGVVAISVPRAPLPAEVFELVRALAGQPGIEDVPAKLEGTGTGRVSVTLASPALSPPEQPAAPPPTPRGSAWLGTEGILRGEPMTDIASPESRVPGVPQVTHDSATPAPETALPSEGRRVTGAALPSSAPPPAPPPPAPTPGSQAAAPAPASARPKTTPAGPLEQLEAAPDSPDVGDLLALLGRQIEEAVAQKRLEQALRIIAALVRLEQRVPEGSARRHYGIALRRLYSKQLLRGLTQLLTVPKYGADAIVVMQRGGADSVEVLMEQLISAAEMGERRVIFDALRSMTVGREQVIPLLNHEKWYVVRNVAELVGELGLEEAVPLLAKAVVHEDERVRKAAALALAKIGTTSTVEPLRRALRDKTPDVRVQVALGVGGRRTSTLAMPLVVALEAEEDETVQRELILALGRIGTPDAVQALIKIAQPSGRLFGRKPAAVRLAAVEALKLAGTAPALGTLEGLSDDGDKQVRAAAQAGVKDVKKKKR